MADYWDSSDEVRGGRWVVRLKALAELAKQKESQIKTIAGRGGRKSFSAHQGVESATDWLAHACHGFVNAYGARTQTAALAMMRVILEIEHGKSAIEHRTDAKPSRDVGRKAVRKAATAKGNDD
jgi:hypothetical protein